MDMRDPDCQRRFCVSCGASFPHRIGEGRCGRCLPRAFNELETAHQELINDRAAFEKAFAVEPLTKALEEIVALPCRLGSTLMLAQRIAKKALKAHESESSTVA